MFLKLNGCFSNDFPILHKKSFINKMKTNTNDDTIKNDYLSILVFFCFFNTSSNVPFFYL